MTANQNSPYHQLIGIRERKAGIWCVTVNGRIPGDSRGYTRQQAEAEARARVASDPEFRTLEI